MDCIQEYDHPCIQMFAVIKHLPIRNISRLLRTYGSLDFEECSGGFEVYCDSLFLVESEDRPKYEQKRPKGILALAEATAAAWTEASSEPEAHLLVELYRLLEKIRPWEGASKACCLHGIRARSWKDHFWDGRQAFVHRRPSSGIEVLQFYDLLPLCVQRWGLLRYLLSA